MKKFFIACVGTLSMIVLIAGIAGLLAKLIDVSIQEMLVYMLIGDYASRIYNDIFG